MFHGEHLAGPPHARLHFVGNIKDAVLVGDVKKLLMEFRRRHDIAPLPLDGFDKDGGNLLRGNSGAKKRVLDPVHAGRFTGRITEPVRAAIAIRIRDVGDSRHQGIIVFLLNRLAGGEGEGSHGAAVEGAKEGQVQFAPGVPAGQFESRLDRFCARVAKIDLPCARDPAQDRRVSGPA